MVRIKIEGTAAFWDKENTLLFCDICLQEIEFGNRPTTHFNKEGWSNITKNFGEKAGKAYERLQLKNKWDQLKKDWKLWKDLKRGSTGLGWDPKKKTIDAPNDWWKEKLKVYPHAKKFRYAGIEIELEERLDIMFSGVVASGSSAWIPSSKVQELNESVNAETNPIEDEVHIVEDVAECSNTKKPLTCVAGKRKRGSDFLRDEISLLVDVCTNVSKEEEVSEEIVAQPTISEALTLLTSLEEVYNDVQLYMFSVDLLENTSKRESFMAMPSERRVDYLRYCYEKSNKM